MSGHPNTHPRYNPNSVILRRRVYHIGLQMSNAGISLENLALGGHDVSSVPSLFLLEFCTQNLALPNDLICAN